MIQTTGGYDAIVVGLRVCGRVGGLVTTDRRALDELWTCNCYYYTDVHSCEVINFPVLGA